MSRPVYILGAGFSHNFDREIFPLVSGFLAKAKECFIYQPDDQDRELGFVIRKYFGDNSYPDIEKVLSFLSASPLYNRQVPGERRAMVYDDLVKIIVLLLARASESKASSDDIQETYQRFAALLYKTESTIITFNYDLLVENLLMQTHKWHRYDGYGVHIPLAHKAMPTSPHTFLHQSIAEDTDTKWSPVTVLKLHGSINWGSPIIADERDNQIYQVPLSGGVSMADFAVRTEHGSPFTQYFNPVIVPPVLDKSSWLRNPTFKVLWHMAMEAIENAEQITFVGYSLRATDFMAEFMFRQAINLRTMERRIVVVDPKARELEERFRDVFGSTPAPALEMSFQNCDFVSYANSLFSSEI